MRPLMVALIAGVVIVLGLAFQRFIVWLRFAIREARFAWRLVRLVGNAWVERFDPCKPCPACWRYGSVHFVNMKRTTLHPAEIETIAQLITADDADCDSVSLLRSSVVMSKRNKPAHVCYRPKDAPPTRHVEVVLKSAGTIQ